MPEVVKANMRQPCFLKDFSEGMADYAWVKRLTIDTAEYEVTIN
jgi:hypothetical protein